MKNSSLKKVYVRLGRSLQYLYLGNKLIKATGLYLPKEGTTFHEDGFIPFDIYEKEDDLPEELRVQINTPRYPSGLQHPLPPGKEGEVYIVIKNTDSVGDIGGYNYIMAILENLTLAEKLAIGNGPSGSNASVIKVDLDTPLKRQYNQILPIYQNRDQIMYLDDLAIIK